jgi:hypothetical protein
MFFFPTTPGSPNADSIIVWKASSGVDALLRHGDRVSFAVCHQAVSDHIIGSTEKVDAGRTF